MPYAGKRLNKSPLLNDILHFSLYKKYSYFVEHFLYLLSHLANQMKWIMLAIIAPRSGVLSLPGTITMGSNGSQYQVLVW